MGNPADLLTIYGFTKLEIEVTENNQTPFPKDLQFSLLLFLGFFFLFSFESLVTCIYLLVNLHAQLQLLKLPCNGTVQFSGKSFTKCYFLAALLTLKYKFIYI